MTFEREFLKLASVVLGCHLAAMGGSVKHKSGRGDLGFHLLGIVDYCGEMRVLCDETLRRAA